MVRTLIRSSGARRGLSVLASALLAAALSACADAGPEPSTPTPEGPTGKAAVPYPIAPEPSPAATDAPGSPPAATATAAPTAAPAPDPTATAGPTTEVVIDLRVRDAKKEGGKITYDADGMRMTATHRIYELDAAEVEKAVAKSKDASGVRLRLACGPASTRVFAGDPKGARPMGGFTYETRACTIVEVLASE